jgi:hypothetical protein
LVACSCRVVLRAKGFDGVLDAVVQWLDGGLRLWELRCRIKIFLWFFLSWFVTLFLILVCRFRPIQKLPNWYLKFILFL